MLSAEQVREDLKEIRYYYAMKHVFDAASKTVSADSLLNKVARYNSVIKNAPARFYILYVSLYVQNTNQSELAEAWGFTREYIKELNGKLVEYLQTTVF